MSASTTDPVAGSALAARDPLFSEIVNASRDAIWCWTVDGVIISWNRAATRLFGYRPEEIVGQPLLSLVPADRLPTAKDAMQTLRDGGWFGQYETARVAKDGTVIPVELTVSPLRDEDGKPFAVATICRDIRGRRQLEERQALLVGELNHRVRNILAAVGAMAQQSRQRAGTVEDYVATFQQRLQALSKAHDALVKHKHAGAPLNDLVELEIGAFAPDSGRVAVSGREGVMLPATEAQMFCLALHELATNAAKHGAWSANQGRVDVSWAVDADGNGGQTVTFSWTESGGPPIATQPTPSGFGRRLLEGGVAAAMNGTAQMRFDPEGLRFTLTFAIEPGGACRFAVTGDQ